MSFQMLKIIEMSMSVYYNFYCNMGYADMGQYAFMFNSTATNCDVSELINANTILSKKIILETSSVTYHISFEARYYLETF